MIREIINFTENLIEDIPDVMQWNIKPSRGIHIVVELDNEGQWVNKDNEMYLIDTNVNLNDIPSEALVQYEQLGLRVGTSMNKVLDNRKQIFSCSPFILSFKKKSLLNEKLEGVGIEKIIKLLPDYFSKAQELCKNERQVQLSKSFQNQCGEVLNFLHNKKILEKNEDVEIEVQILDRIKNDDYINLYLKNATFEEYRIVHNAYLQDKLFNSNKYNKEIDGTTFGLSNFLNGLNTKKPFLEHKTSINSISGRITTKDALSLRIFESLLINKTLPNPLPITIDNNEINKEIVKIFNENTEPISYRDLLKQLFQRKNIKYLSNYYLINHSKRKSIILNDVDFVPLFRYYFDKPIVITNVFKSGTIRDKKFELTPTIKISSVFDFERIIVKTIFNNSLVKIKEDRYSANYFGDIDPTYIRGGDIMYLLILKYRKSIYEFIYKSKRNAISSYSFNELMYQSILSNIKKDEITGLFSWNNTIKEKLNIWFSLYSLFNNNFKIEENMSSKITELMSKMSSVASGKSHLDNPEEFAFCAGQIVSYLIDRSAASNKNYSLLEPYLQKSKSGQLQDAIAQAISVYKHDISTYKGSFQNLSSDVLTYDESIEFKPLLKYFLAGCFSECVIYQKVVNNNNSNNN